MQAKAILATMDWLADKKESPWDPHTAAKATKSPVTSSSLNRRYEEGIGLLPQGDRARPAAVQRALAARHQPDAPWARTRKPYEQLEICFDNGFQDTATKNSLMLMDSYKNFSTFNTPTPS